MVDRHFSLPSMAELYDHFHFWGCSPDDDFYLEAVMEARSVLDVGCGTGLLLRKAREHGHTGRLVGLDPADAMLAVGRRDRDDVEWTLGDLVEGPYDGEAPPLEEGGFDLVVMTGHAFQVFLTDEETRENLSRVRRLLAPEGRLIFETRNPAARGWEAWNPERVRTVRGPEGRSATSVHRLERVEGDLVTFTSTYTLKGRGGDRVEPQHAALSRYRNGPEPSGRGGFENGRAVRVLGSESADRYERGDHRLRPPRLRSPSSERFRGR